MQLEITKEELYSMIKSAVKDVLHEEKMNFLVHSIPPVSEDEMQDIIALHGEAPGPKEVARREVLDI